MGQDNSKPFYPPPTSFQQCFNDNELCIYKYYLYRRRQDEIENMVKFQFDMFSRIKKRKHDEICESLPEKSINKKHRSVKKNKLFVRCDNGSLRLLTPHDTIWYMLYVKSEPHDDKLKRIFRTRFRIPYFYFIELHQEISKHEIFSRWENMDAVGDQPSNIKLLILGSLRYIGRSWTFDDVSEANGISREVNRKFFCSFIKYGSTVMYKKFVLDVPDSLNMNDHNALFSAAGMNGCMGSGDATNISMLNCPSWASISHKGFKLNLPARTYNLTVTHTKVILCSTTGHPSTWNDKTVVLYDPLLSGVKEGTKYSDNTFKLLEKTVNGDIKEVTYSGAWFMVDNGYLNWSCTVPPVKNAVTYQSIRFSEWLESMRKDVECTFGIMKQRFSILRYGVRMEKIKNVDEIWLTCCALHNKLIFIDGLDKDWDIFKEVNNNVNQSNNETNTVPFSISRLNRNLNSFNSDCMNTIHESVFKEYTINGNRVVNKMPLDLFRQCLINHFDIRFKMNSIKWPKHIKNKPTAI